MRSFVQFPTGKKTSFFGSGRKTGRNLWQQFQSMEVPQRQWRFGESLLLPSCFQSHVFLALWQSLSCSWGVSHVPWMAMFANGICKESGSELDIPTWIPRTSDLVIEISGCKRFRKVVSVESFWKFQVEMPKNLHPGWQHLMRWHWATSTLESCLLAEVTRPALPSPWNQLTPFLRLYHVQRMRLRHFDQLTLQAVRDMQGRNPVLWRHTLTQGWSLTTSCETQWNSQISQKHYINRIRIIPILYTVNCMNGGLPGNQISKPWWF